MLLAGIALAAAGSIAGVPLSDPRARRDAVVLADLSRSVHAGRDPVFRNAWALVEELAGEPRRGEVALVGFGAAAATLLPWTPPGGLAAARDAASRRMASLSEAVRDGSALEAGLRAALALARPGIALDVVVTGDGRYPEAAWDQAGERLRDAGHSLRFRAAGVEPHAPDLRLSLDGPPPRLRAHEPATIRLKAEGRGRPRRRARIFGGGVAEDVVVDSSAGPTLLQLRVQPPEHGVLELRISGDGGDDADPKNDRVIVPVETPGKPRVAVLGRGADGVAALLARDFVVMRGASLGPGEAHPDVLVLADQEVDAAFEAMVPAIERAVRNDGAGLVVLGGAHAFRAGGYAGSPLDALLPLSSRLPRRREIAVLLDRSGSMDARSADENPRLKRAVEGVLRTARTLPAEDRIQVVPFADAPGEPIPGEPGDGAALGASASALWALRASGGTSIVRALESLPWLASPSAPGSDLQRVALVVSDFKDRMLGEARERLRAALAAAKVALVAVLLDPEAETEADARALGADVRPVKDLTPEIVLQAMSADGWSPGERSLRWLDAAAAGRAPERVSGLNPVVAGKDARVLAETAGGDPVLAVARRGAAEVAALAADPVRDRALAPIVADLVRTAGQDGGRGWTVDALGERIEVRALDPAAPPPGPLELRQGGRAFVLREEAPGFYMARGGIVPFEPCVLFGRNGERLGRLPSPVFGDPEFATAPAVLRDLAATGSPLEPVRLRWPFEAALVALLAAWVVLVTPRP